MNALRSGGGQALATPGVLRTQDRARWSLFSHMAGERGVAHHWPLCRSRMMWMSPGQQDSELFM